MVASKSAKPAKLSYPERVLGAFAKVQREHKRHAVHVLTLRAQVKRTAQAKKDKLGPHWSSFVGKAVQKLESEGILAASNPASLVLTADGKQAIAAARQALSIPAHAVLSTEEEEMVWRQVIHQGFSRGIKRPRRSSFLSRDDNDNDDDDDDDDDDEEDEELSHVVPSRPKRARVSFQHPPLAQGSVAATSQAELTSGQPTSQRTHDGTVRTGSPLTDLEDENDENGLRRNELMQKGAEVARARRELNQARARALNKANGKSPARFPTPDTAFGYDASSPVPGSALPTRSRPLQRVTGPQSGSFISNMSQQPTPTPSTHRTGQDEDDEPPDSEEDAENAYNQSNSLVTPDHSPPASRTNLPTTKEPGIAEKVADLERQLGSRKWDLERLQEKYARLQDRYLTIEDDLIDRDTHITTLQADVVTLEKQKSENASTIERQTSDLSKLQVAKDEMEVSFLSRVKELEQLVQTREGNVVALKSENEKYLNELSEVQDVLNRTELHVTAQASHVAIAEGQAAALRFTLEAAAAELESQKISQMQILAEKESLREEFEVQRLLVDGLEEEKKAHLEQISNLEGSISILKATIETMSEALTSATSKNDSTSEKLKSLESGNESVLAQLSVVQGEKSALAVALEVSEASVVSLTSQAASLKDALSQENTHTAEYSASLSRAETDIVTLQEKVNVTERSVSILEADLKTSNASVEELRIQLQAATGAGEALALQLEEAQKGTADSAASLTEVNSALATTTNNLRDAQEATTKLQATLDTTAVELQGEQDKNQKLVESLATNESELRETVKKLAMVESMAGKFREESEANDAIAKDLRAQLLEAREEITATTDLLSVAEVNGTQESEKHQAAISAFEKLLQSARTESDDLKSQLQAACATHEGLEASLNEQRACLTLAKDQLDTERARVLELESEVDAAIGKVQEVEEEVAELRVSKEADEKTIQNLKEMFTSLREAQMRSLAELDSQVVSAQSSPVPKRRSTRTATTRLAPLKLVK